MSQLINENCIVFDMEGSKKDIIRTLAGELYRAGRITDTDEFYEDVLAREAITPTYVGFDMGLPHGKTDHVLEASVCFGRTKEPVAWNEESGESADLIILIAVPLGEEGDTHLKILANLINYSLPKPCLTVNPILQAEDRTAIDLLGIPRKALLSSYYSIEEKLGFLDEATRGRVMEVVKKELGYQTVQVFHSPKSFSSFLKYDCIAMEDTVSDWKEAVLC